MTPERWQLISSLLQEALERSPTEREAFLDEVCGDEFSRHEVQSLLSFDKQVEDFLEVPALQAAAHLFAGDETGSLAGHSIGWYRIESLIDIGGNGEVYLAEDTKLDRKVAIKFLPIDLETDDLARRRLINEAKSAAKLDHPNICNIYEVAEEANRIFIVMQYVKGQTLASRIKRGPMALRESLDVIIQVAEALSLAHSRGIIHRDITPRNIMINTSGHVTVLDFGLAKVVHLAGVEQGALNRETSLSVSGVIVGTPPYMSPEQARGATVDPRSDLFSLGAVLYECVAGKPAFAGNTAMETCAQVIHINPSPPSHLNSRIPLDLDRVVLRALSKELDSRYQSVGELLEDLRALRDDIDAENIKTKKLQPTPTPWRRLLEQLPQRWRGVFASIPLVMALALIPLIIQWLSATPHRPPPQALYWCEKGTSALHEGLYYTASKALERAVQLDDNFALAHVRLAESWTELDYTDKAKDELLRVPDRSSLPRSEVPYIEAIRNTVLREFAPAIESYKQIAQQAPEKERARIYVDLGRAYEKNDQLEEARQNYQEATTLAPQEAAGYLRLGVVSSMQRDYGAAAQAFDSAESLYQTLNNLEGETEVACERGVLFANQGRLPDARTQLQRALDMARALESKHQQIRTLLELSRALYLGGSTTQAQQAATEAIELARANGMENLSTQGLIHLGNAYSVNNNHQDAEKYFKQALEFATANKGRRNEGEALLSLGSLHMNQHDPDGGLRYIEPALSYFEKAGFRKEASRALLLLGDANDLRGDYPAALQAYDKQLLIAGQIDDRYQIAVLEERIGFVCAHQEQYAEALRHFQDSYDIRLSMGNQLHIASALLNRGDMLWRLGRYDMAKISLDQASSIADRLDGTSTNHWVLARLHLINTHLALSEQQYLKAKTEGREALALNQDTGHEVEVKYALGLAQSLSGDKRRGRLTCEQAARIAARTGDPRMLSSALLAQARTALEAGDGPEALATALRALESFARAGQQDSEWRALIIAGRASRITGDEAAVKEYAGRALGVLSSIQQKWSFDAYSGYLTRPDVNESRSLLSQLLQEKR